MGEFSTLICNSCLINKVFLLIWSYSKLHWPFLNVDTEKIWLLPSYSYTYRWKEFSREEYKFCGSFRCFQFDYHQNSKDGAEKTQYSEFPSEFEDGCLILLLQEHTYAQEICFPLLNIGANIINLKLFPSVLIFFRQSLTEPCLGQTYHFHRFLFESVFAWVKNCWRIGLHEYFIIWNINMD